ncbi:MAG TPA: SurA N-terminal domain-containing protein [Candidatus Acidoferrales bacterium]
MFRFRRAIAVLSLTPVFLAGACSRDAAPAAGVWATVNDQPISREETEKYYRARLTGQAGPPSQDEALSLTLSVLDELINNEMLIQRARQLGLEATDGEVEDKFTESKSPYTEDEFQRQLKDGGMTVDDLRRNIRRQVSIQKLLNREVLAKISITDQDVTGFYNQNRAQFNVTETQYRIAQIVVTPRKDPQVRNRKNDDAASDVEARRKSAALLQQLRDGADFGALAMDYSEDAVSAASGGDLGFIPESALTQTDATLRRMVAGMTPGQVSDTVRLADGYRILKLVAKEVPGQRELASPQVQQSIRDTLRSRKEQLMRAAYLLATRDQTRVVNYLARQVLESAGKLPEIKILPPAAVAPAAAPQAAPSQP